MKSHKRACFSSLLLATWGHSEGLAVCSPERALTKTQPGWHPDLGLPVSGTVRNEFLLFIKHSVYGICVTASELRQKIGTKIWVAPLQVPKNVETALELGKKGQKTLEVQPRKSLHCCEQAIKDDSGNVSEGKEESLAKASTLEDTYIIMNRMLEELWTIKAILMKFQTEMRNVLLETGGRTRDLLKSACVLVLCGR